MKLGVVILNWNAADDTAGCIGCVRAWAPAIRPTIWVVDNASREPGIERMRQEHPEVHFLCSDVNRGFAGGSNLGIKAALEAGSEAVLLLNNDASVDAASVASMLETLRSDPGVGVVGPILWDDGTLLSAGGRDMAWHAATHLRPRRLPTAVLDVEYVPGTVALVSRRVLECVGLLDEEYFFAGELADFCRRARTQGFRCVTDPRARACHRLERSAALRETLHVYYVFRNRFLYIRKHHPCHKAWLYGAWVARGALAAVTAAARGNLAGARAICLGVLDGVGGHFGGQNDRILGRPRGA